MTANKTRIGIIGFGRFGTLAASVLKKYGEVRVYDKRQQIRRRANQIGVDFFDLKTVAACDIVILCVPISRTEAIIKKIANLVKPGSLIVDTCSVKTYPCQWLKQYLPNYTEYFGTHPMFGPITSCFNEQKQVWKLKGLQIVLCPLHIKPVKFRSIKQFLQSLGLEIIITSPEDHDRQTAVTLSFMHFLGRSLWQSGFREKKIYPPGYKDLLGVYRTTTGDSWELMYDMNNYNPYAAPVRQRFLDICQKIEDKIEVNGRQEELFFYRKIIDKIDRELMQLLKRRFKYVKKIGQIKQRAGRSIVDQGREREIIERNFKLSQLDKKFIKELYQLIFIQARKMQKDK